MAMLCGSSNFPGSVPLPPHQVTNVPSFEYLTTRVLVLSPSAMKMSPPVALLHAVMPSGNVAQLSTNRYDPESAAIDGLLAADWSTTAAHTTAIRTRLIKGSFRRDVFGRDRRPGAPRARSPLRARCQGPSVRRQSVDRPTAGSLARAAAPGLDSRRRGGRPTGSVNVHRFATQRRCHRSNDARQPM